MGELVVQGHLYVVRLVVRSIVPGASVDGVGVVFLRLTVLCAGEGIRQPAVKFALALADHGLYSVGLAFCCYKVFFKLRIHNQGCSGNVVQAASMLLPVALKGEVNGIVACPIESCCGLIAGLRLDIFAGQNPNIHRRNGRGIRYQMYALTHGVDTRLNGEVSGGGVFT